MAILFQKLDKDDKTQDARDVLEASLTKQAGEKISSQDKQLVAEWFGWYATLHKTIRKDS